tara:strand:+ start:345 stop:926 length:582 start_codon:yes stop_codon:yes gene_type:complete
MNKQQTLPGLEKEVIGKTKELSEDKIITKQRSFNPQELKPGSGLDDVARNMLIEESKARDLSSEEIQYLMTDEYYRNKKPTTPAKKKSKLPYLPATTKYNMYKAVASPDELKEFPDEIKKAKAKELLQQLKDPINLNFNTSLTQKLEHDRGLDLQKQRLDQMIEESEQEKAREKLVNSTQGLMSFAPRVFDND